MTELEAAPSEDRPMQAPAEAVESIDTGEPPETVEAVATQPPETADSVATAESPEAGGSVVETAEAESTAAAIDVTEPPAAVGPSPAETESAADAPGSEAETPAPRPVAHEGPRTVGRFVADALRSAGVRYAFTVPGESFLGLLDAFEGAGIRVIATRHEGAAAFMAEAHGQLTGRPAVCLGTRAVGSANLAIGIHTARQDSTPLFAVVGQVERRLRGREAFQ